MDKKIFQKFKLPKPNSHKGDNGRLLIVAGSKRFHGSLIYALKIASRIVDLIYVLTTKDNSEVIRKLKIHTAEFIPVNELGSYLKYVDCVLIGPGMGVSKNAKRLVERVLKSGAKAVLDADALNVLDERLKKLLNQNHILTPHKKELSRLFPGVTDLTIVKSVTRRYGCTIVLKGRVDIIASPQKIMLNKTGNQGMTKGGTGDVLAGLIAAFYCLPMGDHPKGDKNSAFRAAAAGTYLNGLAGDELYKKVGPYYNAEDLVDQIPIILWSLRGVKRRGNPKKKRLLRSARNDRG